MSTDANKQIVRRYQDAYNSNNLDALDEVVSAEISTPNMLPGFPPGLAGLKALHQVTIDAWPDSRGDIEELLAEGEYVVARLTISATPAKDAFGVPANGNSFRISGHYIVRIQDGKIVEHVGVEDVIGIMQQMGLMPLPDGL